MLLQPPVTLARFRSELFLYTFPCAILLASACGNSSSAGAGHASADASESAEVLDAGAADAPDLTDANSLNLADLVDALLDEMNAVIEMICTCDPVSCAENAVTPISPEQRACMQAAIAGQAATPELLADLTCAGDAMANDSACVSASAETCDLPAMFACFEAQPPACLDSPLFATAFEACLND